MEAEERYQILLGLRALATEQILAQPYNLRLYLQRALYHEELGYGDLAASDAYRALLLTDEIEDGEFHDQARAALSSTRSSPYENISVAEPDGVDASEWLDRAAGEAAVEACVILGRSLLVIGDLRSANDFVQRGIKKDVKNAALMTLSSKIVAETQRRNGASLATSNTASDIQKSLPRTGFARRELYAWNDHEPDRTTEECVSALNADLNHWSSNCEIRAVELPLLYGTDAEKPKQDDLVLRQLGIFATKDIDPGQTVLLEPSILTANNRLLAPLCDACSAVLPPIDASQPVYTCEDCDDIFFCSETCLVRAQELYHPAVCGIDDFDTVARDPSSAAATDALYVLLLVRVVAMSLTQGIHPLDLSHVKYLWGDFTPQSLDKVERKLPFSFEANIYQPMHILTLLGLDPFATSTIENFDTWVLNVLFAKFRGVASAKLNPQTLRPDVAAVHPLWSLANHSCAPNVRWEWGAEDGNFRGKEKGAMGFVARSEEDIVQWGDQDRKGGIAKGAEVLNHYCDVRMDVAERREWAIGALGGICMCERCLWEEEHDREKNQSISKDLARLDLSNGDKKVASKI